MQVQYVYHCCLCLIFEQQYQILKAKATKALGTSLLIIPELRVLVLTKRHVGSGNEIASGRVQQRKSAIHGLPVTLRML